MFSVKSVLVALATVAGLGAAAMAATTSFTNANHKHNMNNTFTGVKINQGEICLPCHAPHNTNKDLEALWNHTMPAASSYTLYDGNNGDGKLDIVSRMCLSCHDGTIGIDNYGTKTGPSGGTHKLAVGVTDAWGNDSGAYLVGAGGDLRHDHPVGVEYPGWNGTAFDATAGRGFKSPIDFNTSTYTLKDKTSGTEVITTPNYRNAADSANTTVGSGGFRLSSVTVGGEETVVGCGFCHGPHTNSNGNFLKVPNTNSQLCLTCHDK